MKQAAELAAEEINAAGGINGRRLELVIRDDYADPDSAVFVASDLYDSDVSAVVGHLFSGTTLAAAPVYNGGADPVVAISPVLLLARGHRRRATTPSGSAPATWPTAPRWPTGCATGSTSRAAPCSTSTIEYGRGIRQTFVAEFIRLGGELEAVDPYLGDRPDVGPVSRPPRRGPTPEFLVVAGQPERGGGDPPPGAEARTSRMPVLGGDGLEGIQEAGALAEGVYLSSPYFPSIPDARPTAASSRRSGASTPTPALPNQPAAGDLRRGLPAAGRHRPGRARARGRCAGRSPASASVTPPFEGVTGTVAFDANGDVPNQNVYIGLVQQGAVDGGQRRPRNAVGAR